MKKLRLLHLFSLAVLLISGAHFLVAAPPPSDWQPASPREEIRPQFSFQDQGGKDGQGEFRILCDERDYLQGAWVKKYPIQGGEYYRFEAWYKATGVQSLRRSVYVEILWRDDRKQGGPIVRDNGGVSSDEYGRVVSRETTTRIHYLAQWTPQPAGAEYLEETGVEKGGWKQVSGVLLAPKDASAGVVKLVLQWAPRGEVIWSGVSVEKSAPPPERKVRLAAVHFNPRGGKTPEDNLRMCEPLIAEAAQKKADLVVLGGHIETQNLGSSKDFAEPIPGPSSRKLGELAKKYNLYIVAGLIERDGPKIQPAAVLMGPDGSLVGKFHKATLTTDEIDSGETPGTEYPVFQTRFGKVGMMICYDGMFPDVARRLSENGAEIIAWPVYGSPLKQAVARAMDNQVYLVSSTYTEDRDWVTSAVFDREGEIIAQAIQPASVAVAEVDLNQPTYWISVGNFRSRLPRHRPLWNETK